MVGAPVPANLNLGKLCKVAVSQCRASPFA